jgi:hypothetical protein
LSHEARALLAAAAERGIFESARLRLNLIPATECWRFLLNGLINGVSFSNELESQDVLCGYLETFRELCEQGLVIHQLQKEFSLTEPRDSPWQRRSRVKPSLMTFRLPVTSTSSPAFHSRQKGSGRTVAGESHATHRTATKKLRRITDGACCLF